MINTWFKFEDKMQNGSKVIVFTQARIMQITTTQMTTKEPKSLKNFAYCCQMKVFSKFHLLKVFQS